MDAKMFFDIANMRILPGGLIKINGDLLYLTNRQEVRNNFFSKTLLFEYGNTITRHTPDGVFGYSNFSLSGNDIISPDQFQNEYLNAFRFRARLVESFITFLWFVKDNSVGLLGTFGEVPAIKLVNGKSKSIVNYNCQCSIQDTEFTEKELLDVGKLTIKYDEISGAMKKKPDSTSIFYLYNDDGKSSKGIEPKTPVNFNYNEQNNIDRALHFLTIARNQDYVVYKVAYYMPIFECLFNPSCQVLCQFV